MSKWKQYSVAGLIADGKLVIGDGYRAKNDELTTHGLPFARAGNINCGFQFEDADHFPKENVSRIGNKVSEPGDVVFTSKGTVGRFALVRDDTQRFVYSPQLCFWRPVDDTLIEPRFLYFWMYGREFFLQYKGVAGQTDMAEYVSLGDQRQMHITLPEISEQRAIAAVLGALDDKIELNRRMNETLEALAQSLSKSWFVDATQSALPKGWREGSILEVAKLLSGGTPKTEREDYWNGEILWASAKDVSQCGQTFLVTTERTITEKGLEESATQLIPAFCTVVVARGATTGRMTMFGRDIAMNQTCYALASTTGTPFALYCLFRHAIDALVQTAHGSVFDTITTSTFAASKVVLPPQQVFDAFEKTASPIFARILSNIEESRTLAALRDALLPKLLSGELRVPRSLGVP